MLLIINSSPRVGPHQNMLHDHLATANQSDRLSSTLTSCPHAAKWSSGHPIEFSIIAHPRLPDGPQTSDKPTKKIRVERVLRYDSNLYQSSFVGKGNYTNLLQITMMFSFSKPNLICVLWFSGLISCEFKINPPLHSRNIATIASNISVTERSRTEFAFAALAEFAGVRNALKRFTLWVLLRYVVQHFFADFCSNVPVMSRTFMELIDCSK